MLNLLRKFLGILPRVPKSRKPSAPARQSVPTPIRNLWIDNQIHELQQRIIHNPLFCQQLANALHNAGLEGFSNSLEQIAQHEGFDISASDFIAHVHRHAAKPAAYVVAFCRGGLAS